VRKVINSTEIERALVARGYAVIEPEKLSFIQQAALLAAEAVVASTGPPVNIILPAQCTHQHFLCFADTSYWYWQNIAAASGNVVRYVLGESSRGRTRDSRRFSRRCRGRAQVAVRAESRAAMCRNTKTEGS
jgi:hypothetical protein